MTLRSGFGKYGVQAGGGAGPYIVEFMVVAGGGGGSSGPYEDVYQGDNTKGWVEV